MRYAVLIHYRPDSYAGLSESEQRAITAEYMALRDAPECVEGGRLDEPHTATTLRSHDGTVLTTDGPFADTKEVFGGYLIIDVDDLDQALDYAARVPAVRMGGAVEVRPLAQYPATVEAAS